MHRLCSKAVEELRELESIEFEYDHDIKMNIEYALMILRIG